jgi:hypothetical protein
MKCIWATSLELVWGVFALRMVLENMRAWVYQRVKPEIFRWISVACACSSPRILSTIGGRIEQRGGAIPLEPPQARLPTTPTLSRGKTTPERTTGRPSVNLVFRKKGVQASDGESDMEEGNNIGGSEASEDEGQKGYGYYSDENGNTEDSEDMEA